MGAPGLRREFVSLPPVRMLLGKKPGQGHPGCGVSSFPEGPWVSHSFTHPVCLQSSPSGA